MFANDPLIRSLLLRLRRFSSIACSALCVVFAIAPSIAHALTISPSALNFPDTAAGSSSAAMTITIANGNAQIDYPRLNTVTDSDDFSATNNCSESGLPPGQSCTMSVIFHPKFSGAKSGTLTILDALYNRQSVALTGMGTGNGAPVVTANTVTPTSLDFGAVFDETSKDLTFTYTNNGTSPVTLQPSFSNLTEFAADFNGTCFWNNPVVPAGGSCTYSINFLPLANQNYSATFTVRDGVNNPTVTLVGIGFAANGGSGALVMSPSPINITNVPWGGTSDVNYTLTNTTSQTMVLVDVQVPDDGPDGTQLHGPDGGGCRASSALNPPKTVALAPGESCSDYIEYQPEFPLDNFQGSLVVKYIFQGSNTNITANFPISANSVIHASLGISPNPLQFAATPAGTTSQQTVSVSNSGPALLTFNSATLTSGDAKNFSLTNTCGSTLAGNSACTITVTFAPDSSKTEYTAQLDVKTSDPYNNSTSTDTIVPLTGGTLASDFVVSSNSGAAYYNTQPDNSQTATWIINVAPLDPSFPWNQPVTFKITSDLDASDGAPVFTPASVTPGNTTASTTLTLTKPNSAAIAQGAASTGKLPMLACGVGSLLFCVHRRRKRSPMRPILRLAFVAATTLSLTSCSEAPPPPIQIVVTATSGSVSHTVTLVLQP